MLNPPSFRHITITIPQTVRVWHICIHWSGFRGQCRHLFPYMECLGILSSSTSHLSKISTCRSPDHQAKAAVFGKPGAHESCFRVLQQRDGRPEAWAEPSLNRAECSGWKLGEVSDGRYESQDTSTFVPKMFRLNFCFGWRVRTMQSQHSGREERQD